MIRGLRKFGELIGKVRTTINYYSFSNLSIVHLGDRILGYEQTRSIRSVKGDITNSRLHTTVCCPLLLQLCHSTRVMFLCLTSMALPYVMSNKKLTHSLIFHALPSFVSVSASLMNKTQNHIHILIFSIFTIFAKRHML